MSKCFTHSSHCNRHLLGLPVGEESDRVRSHWSRPSASCLTLRGSESPVTSAALLTEPFRISALSTPPSLPRSSERSEWMTRKGSSLTMQMSWMVRNRRGWPEDSNPGPNPASHLSYRVFFTYLNGPPNRLSRNWNDSVWDEKNEAFVRWATSKSW